MDFVIARDKPPLNQALFQITHGLYILTAKRGEKRNGQCLDAAMQVTNTPPRIAISVSKTTLTHEMIKETGLFILNVIDKENSNRSELIRHFGFQSGRSVNKFASIPFENGENGAPIIADSKAFYECRVLSDLDLGTHTLFIADVERAGTKEQGEPLTYNEYRKNIKRA